MQRWSPLATAAYSTRIPIRRAAESVDGYWDDGYWDSLDVIEIYIEERKRLLGSNLLHQLENFRWGKHQY